MASQDHLLRYTSPEQLPQTTLLTLQAPGGTKTIHSLCSDLREHICFINTQNRLQKPTEAALWVTGWSSRFRACFKSLFASFGGSRSPGLPKRLPSRFGDPEAVFGTPVQNNCLKPNCRLYKLQVAQKRYTRFVAIIESTSAFLTFKAAPEAHWSGSLSHAISSRFRACLCPLAAPEAQGSLNGSQAVLGSQEAVLEPFSSTL